MRRDRSNQLAIDFIACVGHARIIRDSGTTNCQAYPTDSFELRDLPTSNKPELMENFDASLTVDDVRREDIEGIPR